MTQDEIFDAARQSHLDVYALGRDKSQFIYRLEAFAKLVAAHTLMHIDPSKFMSHQEGFEVGAAKEREAIYQLVMEAPFKEFDRQEEEFDGEAANAMKAMAFSLTSAIRARGEA
jgi:hypothetical protein